MYEFFNSYKTLKFEDIVSVTEEQKGVQIMSTVFTTQQLDAFLKEINGDDLKKMFDSSILSFIKQKSQEVIEEKLTEYWSYVVPVKIGDVVKINNLEYIVTCIYTDNSVDLLGKDVKKTNRGLYGVPVNKVGELQCITV